MITIQATIGKVFKRIHDNFIMGNKIALGIDYSTGTPREDLPEYYTEVFDPAVLPTMDWLKVHIQQWLTENGVAYLSSDTKEQLIERITNGT